MERLLRMDDALAKVSQGTFIVVAIAEALLGLAALLPLDLILALAQGSKLQEDSICFCFGFVFLHLMCFCVVHLFCLKCLRYK